MRKYKISKTALFTFVITLLLLGISSAPKSKMLTKKIDKPMCCLFGGVTGMDFNENNDPYLINTFTKSEYGSIHKRCMGKWAKINYIKEICKRLNGKCLYERDCKKTGHDVYGLGYIFVDSLNNIYAIVPLYCQRKYKSALLFITNYGKVSLVKISEKMIMETRTGNRDSSEPPLIAEIHRKKYICKHAYTHDMYLYTPKLVEDNLVLGKPIVVSKRCLSVADHSGGTSFAVTYKGKSYIVISELPARIDLGNRISLLEIDRMSGRIAKRHFLTYASCSRPDVHCTPVIAMDYDNNFHVIVSGHASPFYYFMSERALDINRWTKRLTINKKGTYATLVIDNKNNLYTVYRAFPYLMYQKKQVKKKWSKPEVLALPPYANIDYVVYYHRLFIDRMSRLFVSYTYYENTTGIKGNYPRYFMESRDEGVSWSYLTNFK